MEQEKWIRAFCKDITIIRSNRRTLLNNITVFLLIDMLTGIILYNSVKEFISDKVFDFLYKNLINRGCQLLKTITFGEE